MKLRYTIIILFIIVIPAMSFGQFRVSNGKNELLITGMVTTFYNYNHAKEGITDHRKNSFYLRDAQLELDGSTKKWEFAMKVDFADLFSATDDPDSPGMMEANVTWKGWKFMDIIAGYQKLPYSRSVQVSFAFSPFFRRAEICRGEFYSQRDIGVTFVKKMWDKKINLYAGIYSGMGEASIKTPNDFSGNPEYLARLEFNWPSARKYRSVDDEHFQKPVITAGFNGRYARKASYSGNDYPIKTIEGDKYVYGFDVNGMWKGLSATFEMHQLFMIPEGREMLYSYNTDYFRAGGWYGELSYHIKPANTVLSGRYQVMNATDLVKGVTRHIDLGAVYMAKSYDSMIKLNFNYNKDEELLPGVNPVKWQWQMTLGWQYMFN